MQQAWNIEVCGIFNEKKLKNKKLQNSQENKESKKRTQTINPGRADSKEHTGKINWSKWENLSRSDWEQST